MLLCRVESDWEIENLIFRILWPYSEKYVTRKNENPEQKSSHNFPVRMNWGAMNQIRKTQMSGKLTSLACMIPGGLAFVRTTLKAVYE